MFACHFDTQFIAQKTKLALRVKFILLFYQIYGVAKQSELMHLEITTKKNYDYFQKKKIYNIL
jgi:hypothetical protein